MDLSKEISPKLSKMPATEPAHSNNVAKVQAQSHVFPRSKFQKKGYSDFSALSTITGDLSLKRAQLNEGAMFIVQQ